MKPHSAAPPKASFTLSFSSEIPSSLEKDTSSLGFAFLFVISSNWTKVHVYGIKASFASSQSMGHACLR